MSSSLSVQVSVRCAPFHVKLSVRETTMRTVISIQCPDCPGESAEFWPGLDDDEPDLAACTDCGAEWEIR